MIAPWIATLRAARPGLLIVGEVKTRSPYGYVNLKAPSRRAMLAALDASPSIDVISIHTHPDWEGSFKWLAEARMHTDKPILAKGFHTHVADVSRALSCGADYVLTVGWCPPGRETEDRCWHECETMDQLRLSAAKHAVWNVRDPRTGDMKHGSLHLARAMRGRAFLCQASGIRRPEDVHPEMESVLIGEGLYA